MKEIRTLCISGGGVKGIAYCGVFEKIQELEMLKRINMNVSRVCCVSAGCFFGLIYVLGYKFAEIKEEILNKSFIEFKDISLKNLFTGYGLDSGKNVTTWLETLIIKKGFNKNITFKELQEQTGIDFQVIATNLDKFEYTAFDNKNTPDMKVTKAIRMSISIPFLFTAESYKDEVYVDGGIINSYPIQYVMEEIDYVLGFRLLSFKNPEIRKIQDLESFVTNLITCLLSQREQSRLHESNEKVKDHTIYIDIDGELSNSVNFAIGHEEKLTLMRMGYDATERYFEQLGKKNINSDGKGNEI